MRALATPAWGALRQGGWARLLALVGGVGLVATLPLPPVAAAADRSFAAHMLEHMLLIDLAAPLLAIAWPLVAAPWRTPLRLPAVAFLGRPGPAVVLATAVLWLWHLPAAYDLALAHRAVHVAEHLSLLGAFVLYWRLLGNAPARPPRLTSNAARALYLLAGALASALLGALLTFWGRVLYPHYAAIPRPGGRSPLADQHLGGAIMWLSGPLVLGVAALVTMREE